jgi:glycerol transport system ATP-binding protein
MAIELRNVSLRVGAETHIYETSLSLEPGQFNILLGTTLSGKTSLMRLMAGLEKPSSGTLWANGEEVTGTRPSSTTRVSVSTTTSLRH